MALEVTVVIRESVAELSLSGQLDAYDLDPEPADRFVAALDSALAAGVTELVLDLREVTYMASVGIRMLLMALQRGGSGRVTVYAVAPQPMVLATIRRTGLQNALLIVDEYPPPAA